MSNLLSTPLLRIYRDPKGGYAMDEAYIPSSTRIDAAPALSQLLSQLLDALRARIDTLYDLHSEPTKNVIEFRSGDTASFWLLHTLNSAYAGLRHLFKHAGLHPERLFEQLLMLAGALLTFSKDWNLSDLPVYEHSNPGPGFLKLKKIILSDFGGGQRRFLRITLQRVEGTSMHQGHIDAGQIKPTSHLYLEVSASIPPTDLIKSVPAQFKLGTVDDVNTAVACATPGVPTMYVPQTPQALPIRPGAVYFEIAQNNKFYERMLKSQSAHLYTPDSGFADLHVALVILHSQLS
jgi:type VI secretion system protein ImpJ